MQLVSIYRFAWHHVKVCVCVPDAQSWISSMNLFKVITKDPQCNKVTCRAKSSWQMSRATWKYCMYLQLWQTRAHCEHDKISKQLPNLVLCSKPLAWLAESMVCLHRTRFLSTRAVKKHRTRKNGFPTSKRIVETANIFPYCHSNIRHKRMCATLVNHLLLQSIIMIMNIQGFDTLHCAKTSWGKAEQCSSGREDY